MVNFEAVAKCLSVHTPHFLTALRVLGIYLGVMLGGCFQQPSVFVRRHPLSECQHGHLRGLDHSPAL